MMFVAIVGEFGWFFLYDNRKPTFGNQPCPETEDDFSRIYEGLRYLRGYHCVDSLWGRSWRWTVASTVLLILPRAWKKLERAKGPHAWAHADHPPEPCSTLIL
jgi:hypothetical protein